MSLKVGIVGAGLAGLACAVELKKYGHQATLFEASDRPGGRIRTLKKDGFLLDRGFQVLLPSYEMAKELFDLDDLQLASFSPGAMVRKNGVFHPLSDPLRNPSHILKMLVSPLATLGDKLRVLQLIFATRGQNPTSEDSQSTAQYLTTLGFSPLFIQSFITPFFSGVFLETSLKTNASFFRYLFDKFSQAEASLPMAGMEALPSQLVKIVGAENCVCNTQIHSVGPKTIALQNGSSSSFDAVVLAVGRNALKALGVASEYISNSDPHSNFEAVTTHYYKTQSTTFADPTLFLNSDPDGPVNHVACLSAVAKSYAPRGWHLFSVNVLGAQQPTESMEVRAHLAKIFGDVELQSWAWMHTDVVRKALPRDPNYGGKTPLSKDGFFVCGDFMESPSIQGALLSGKKAATALMNS